MVSTAKRNFIDKYNLEKYSRMDVRIPKELNEQLEKHLEEIGKSKRAYLIELIEKDLGK